MTSVAQTRVNHVRIGNAISIEKQHKLRKNFVGLCLSEFNFRQFHFLLHLSPLASDSFILVKLLFSLLLNCFLIIFSFPLFLFPLSFYFHCSFNQIQFSLFHSSPLVIIFQSFTLIFILSLFL